MMPMCMFESRASRTLKMSHEDFLYFLFWALYVLLCPIANICHHAKRSNCSSAKRYWYFCQLSMHYS